MIFTGQIPYDVFLVLLEAAKKLRDNEWKTHSAERVAGLREAIEQAEQPPKEQP